MHDRFMASYLQNVAALQERLLHEHEMLDALSASDPQRGIRMAAVFDVTDDLVRFESNTPAMAARTRVTARTVMGICSAVAALMAGLIVMMFGGRIAAVWLLIVVPTLAVVVAASVREPGAPAELQDERRVAAVVVAVVGIGVFLLADGVVSVWWLGAVIPFFVWSVVRLHWYSDSDTAGASGQKSLDARRQRRHG